MHQATRALTTVVFVDVVGSTAFVEELGDAGWRERLGRFYGLARDELGRAGGTEVVTTGDGLLATFGAPAAAVRFGLELQRATAGTGLPLRVGIHTAEVEVLGDDIAGLGVHVGSRVAGLGAPGEVWVTRTVRDVVAGSGLRFDARGTHHLRGLSEPWELHAALQ
jgi:class 3 adenylate cyclase